MAHLGSVLAVLESDRRAEQIPRSPDLLRGEDEEELLLFEKLTLKMEVHCETI